MLQMPDLPHALPPELAFLRPVVLPDLRRLGPDNDGGYIVPAHIVTRVQALCVFGIRHDWRFEEQFLSERPDCKLHAFDHTTKPDFFKAKLLSELKRLFKPSRALIQEIGYSWRMWRSFQNTFNGTRRQFFCKRIFNRVDKPYDITVDEVMNGFLDETEVLVKVDIEGCEYRIIDPLLKYVGKIPCLLVEFHDTEPFRMNFQEKIRTLQRDYAIVHLHGNNFAGSASDGLPEVLELTFLRNDLLPAQLILRDQLPIKTLDQPNNRTKQDFLLRFTWP